MLKLHVYFFATKVCSFNRHMPIACRDRQHYRSTSNAERRHKQINTVLGNTESEKKKNLGQQKCRYLHLRFESYENLSRASWTVLPFKINTCLPLNCHQKHIQHVYNSLVIRNKVNRNLISKAQIRKGYYDRVFCVKI
jgi:hypothetical protein